MLKMSRVLVIPANMNGNETIQALLMRVASSHATLLLTRKEDENEEAVRNIASIFGFEPSQFVEVYVQCREAVRTHGGERVLVVLVGSNCGGGWGR